MNELLRDLLFLPEQASTVAREIDLLHYAVIGVTMVGWLAVSLATAYFLLKYRRRHEGQRTHSVHASARLEAALVLGLLALFLAWWFVGAAQFVKLREPPAGAMPIYVTGKQWMWKFAYPDGRSAVSVLTVPVGRPVKLLMTSRDVIHSFYVPAFRIKHDVLPGRYTTVWFEVEKAGTYDIFCTEYCGLLHSNMLGRVVALAPEAYDAWLESTQPHPPGPAPAPGTPEIVASATGTSTALAVRGREVAARFGCLGCHTLDGRPHIGPSWAGVFAADVELEGGKRRRVDEEYLTRSMMDPRAELRAGFSPVMPSYQGLLPPAETAALVELIKSLEHAEEPRPLIPPWTGRPPREAPP